ncbi:MAG: RNA-binding S4 domain-containing protein [Alphaproteobacteria bacterium]
MTATRITPAELTPAAIRLDKWLWQARFCKSRSLAAKLCASGAVRVSHTKVHKPHHAVKAGDVLTFPLGPHIRVIRILAIGTRRGPATEARTLYQDLSPPPPRGKGNAMPRTAVRSTGAGRPTKADRRAIMRLNRKD